MQTGNSRPHLPPRVTKKARILAHACAFWPPTNRRHSMRTGLVIALGFAAVLVAPSALAQDNGDGSTAVEPPKVTTTVKTTTTTPAAAAAPKADDGVTDHEKVVGHLGVGYLGLTQIPIGSGGGG